MFFYLGKLLPQFLFPPGFQIVLIAISLILIRKRPRVASLLLFIAGSTLYLLSTGAVEEQLAGGVETKYPELTPAEAPPADAIVVLGDFVAAPNLKHPQLELKAESDRLRSSGLLYRAGKAPFVLLTGGSVSLFGNVALAQAVVARDLLASWGVPADSILTEAKSQNTYENAVFSKPMLQARNARKILLVTSAFHMPRSAAIFRRQGFDVVPFPTDFHTGWYDPVFPLNWVPDSLSLYDNRMALHEYFGLFVYKLRGWA